MESLIKEALEQAEKDRAKKDGGLGIADEHGELREHGVSRPLKLGDVMKTPFRLNLDDYRRPVKTLQPSTPKCRGYLHNEDFYDGIGKPVKIKMDLIWLMPEGYGALSKVVELGTYEGSDILTPADIKNLKADVTEGVLKQDDFKLAAVSYEKLGGDESYTIFCTDIFASQKIQQDMQTAWEGYICEVGKKTKVTDLIPKHSLTKDRKIEKFLSNVTAELRPEEWLKKWIPEENKKISPEELPVSMIEFSPNLKLAAGVTSLWWNDSLLPNVYLALVKKNEEGKKPIWEICRDAARNEMKFLRPVGTEEPIRYIV